MENHWMKSEKNPVYEVNRFGCVVRLISGKRRPIKPQIHKKGYLKVGLGKSGKEYVHRMVGLAFVGNTESKPHINHLDGNKLNCCWLNLEWCTPTENNDHAADVLRITSKIPVVLIKRDGTFVGRYRSKKNCLESIGSLRGYVMIPEKLYTDDYVRKVLNKPRKPRKKYTVSKPNWRRKLSDDQVREIVKLGNETDMKLYHIAKKVGCDYTTVSKVLLGIIYREVSVSELKRYGVNV